MTKDICPTCKVREKHIKSKECRSCSKKGSNNGSYRGGHHCIDCGKEVANGNIKRCWDCHLVNKGNLAGEDNPNWRGGKSKYDACPECGNKKRDISKLCAHCSKLGERNPSWNGGKTKPHVAHYAYSDYHRLKKEVFQYYKYTCILCGTKGRDGLEFHHIRPQNEYPELALDFWNCVPLCNDCHNLTKGNEKEYEAVINCQRKIPSEYRENLNLLDTEVWQPEASLNTAATTERRDTI